MGKATPRPCNLLSDHSKLLGASPWGRAAGGWENTSIESFLEAATAWATDSDFGLKQGLAENNTWKRFAVFLNAGKIYE